MNFADGGVLETPWGKGEWGLHPDDPSGASVYADFVGAKHNVRFELSTGMGVSTRCAAKAPYAAHSSHTVHPAALIGTALSSPHSTHHQLRAPRALCVPCSALRVCVLRVCYPAPALVYAAGAPTTTSCSCGRSKPQRRRRSSERGDRRETRQAARRAFLMSIRLTKTIEMMRRSWPRVSCEN